MRITNHALDRIRERGGLHADSALRMAQRALEKGLTRKDVTGSFGRYMDGEYLKYRNANNIWVYGEFMYLFCGEDLITYFQVPLKYRKVAVKLQKERR